MDALQIGALIVLIVGVGAWLVARFLTRRRTSEPRLVAPIDALDPEVREQVQVLVRLGQHTDAIRLVRQQTGLGLIEGRDLVSSLK